MLAASEQFARIVRGREAESKVLRALDAAGPMGVARTTLALIVTKPATHIWLLRRAGFSIKTELRYVLVDRGRRATGVGYEHTGVTDDGLRALP